MRGVAQFLYVVSVIDSGGCFTMAYSISSDTPCLDFAGILSSVHIAPISTTPSPLSTDLESLERGD